MTDKEIVQALRCMATRDERRDCEIAKRSQLGCAECVSSYIRDAAAAIERLTAENAALREAHLQKNKIQALFKAKLDKFEAERDAAIADLADIRSCRVCKHVCDTRDCSSCKSKTCKCRECHLDKNAWEWRGLPEAPEG